MSLVLEALRETPVARRRIELSGQSRGFGFVEMSTDVEAKAAVEALNGQMLEGRRLKVEMASPQASRSGGFRSGGFGGSRSGGFGGGKARAGRW